MSPRRRAAPPGPTDVEVTTDKLRRRILSGELPPDTWLREEALADEFRLSRHTVRRALDRLTAERLLKAQPYRGVCVASLSEREVVELQQMRMAFESEAVRLIISEHGNAWPSDLLVPIEAALDALELAVREDRDVEVAHSGFHQSLVDAAGNSRISGAYAGLSSETLLFVRKMRPHFEQANVVEVHRQYLRAAMTRGDVAVREHMEPWTTPRPP